MSVVSFWSIAQDHLKSCWRIIVTHRMIMRMIFDIAIVDNDDEDNDNYCHPPDAISASIKRSSKIESLPRSLPHWGEILKGSFREDIFWEDIKSFREDIEHFSFFVCAVSRVVGGYKDGNFVCNTKGEELNFMLEINIEGKG